MKNSIFILYLLPLAFFAQSVKGHFTPPEKFTYAFLYKSTPNGVNYENRAQLDSLGHFEIPMDSTLTSGIYKIVYALPPESNNFDFIYDGKETVDFSFSFDKGVTFNNSLENKLWNSYIKSIDMVNQTVSNFFTQKSADSTAFKAIFKTLKDTQSAYEESAKNKIVATFIKASRPYVPDNYEDLPTYIQHLKAHYLEQIDFDNPLLQSSSFLTGRVISYVFNIEENPTNTVYKTLVLDVESALKNNDLGIKTILLETIWRRFAAIKNYELANYIADNYLLDLASKTENNALTKMLLNYKNTAIGVKAPNFDISTKQGKTSLHELDNAEHYVLIFWSSSCGHCLNQLPEVKDLVSKKPDIKVVAFALEDNSEKWSETINNYPNFTHVLGLEKWENPVAKTYGIDGTPTYFLLNKDKIIVSKPYALEDLKLTLKDL